MRRREWWWWWGRIWVRSGLLINGLEEGKSSVLCSGDPKWRRAVQAFTSSVHVFWMARARNGLGGGGSECVCRLAGLGLVVVVVVT